MTVQAFKEWALHMLKSLRGVQLASWNLGMFQQWVYKGWGWGVGEEARQTSKALQCPCHSVHSSDVCRAAAACCALGSTQSCVASSQPPGRSLVPAPLFVGNRALKHHFIP